MKNIITVVCAMLALSSCVEDLSEYNYLQTNKVTFDSFLDHDYTWTSGEEVELVAPIMGTLSLRAERRTASLH